jgi:UDP-N-acetylmuramoyl-L-alanyl-D-glutamate--2,6-diaminopimelate ligase
MSAFGAWYYGYPSRHIKVVFITGTQGKSSTTEILAAVLEAAGKRVASAGTIRFKIGDIIEENKFKMTMPGRFFAQRFLRRAVDAQCEYAILEMTSEAAKQFRHRHIDFDALIFLNLSPEHIESHGGYDKYVAAKVSLASALEKSRKENKLLIVNKDDVASPQFVAAAPSAKTLWFSLKQAEPYIMDQFGMYFHYGSKNVRTHLQGTFNIYNILAALTYADAVGISIEAIQKALHSLQVIAGRVQKITLPQDHPQAHKQDFAVVVDYAHTADSLQKVYSVFKESRKVCVLGNTGGGRDTWKRPEMAKVANDHCSHIILTNEDPYDEDPEAIIEQMLPGISSTPHEVIMDRRLAIRRALSLAKKGDTVLITGKGTDPYIMEANNKKTPWSDAAVAAEELEYVLAKRSEPTPGFGSGYLGNKKTPTS